MNGNNRQPYLSIIENIGLINGRYSNVARIDNNGGKGNFSLVFIADDLRSGSQVILKFYSPLHHGNFDRLQRFQREGVILERLKGLPNILECIEGVSQVDVVAKVNNVEISQPYFFIPTKKAITTIHDSIYVNSLKPEDLIFYFKGMCKAVDRIHRMRICHRDIKPDNFFIFPHRDLRLGDFGTAKLFDGSIPDIQTSYLLPVGHMGYVAPELICGIGIGDGISFKADIFSLGATLFEMFAQQTLTSLIYTQNFKQDLILIRYALSKVSDRDKEEAYLAMIDPYKRSITFPDIFSFNNNVPKAIKNHLNGLYKSLTSISYKNRLTDFRSIHRTLDICTLILRNASKKRG